MTKIADTMVARLFAVVVAVAMAFTLAAPAQAQSVDDMSLEELIALVNELKAAMGDSSDDGMMMSSSSVCPYTWTRDLSQGSQGADVMMLQKFLNSMSETMVAPAGQVGSAGMETEFYGPATAAAVSNMQMKYRAEILSPAGLVNPTGYFGPSSRAQANALCASAPMMDDDMMSDDDMMDEDMMDEDEDEMDEEDDRDASDLQGSADLDTYEIEDAEDDEIEEGQEDQPVAEIDIEFDNGDALIQQIELGFELNSGQSGAEEDPWDTFENVSLWVDGDKIAELETDDEDDWEGGDDNELTFSRLDIFAAEDEEVTVVVAVTTDNGLDFDDSDQTNTWTISLESFGNISINEGLRYEDADGFVTEDNPTGDDDTTFEIEEEGAEDELDVRSSDDDPDATVLELEDDSDTEHVVFAFELDATDSENDIEFDQIVVDFTMSSGTLADFADDAVLLVDGQELDTEDETVSGNSVTFDFDSNDFVLEKDEKVDVSVELEFNSLSLANEGVTIRGTMTGNATKIDAEGGDDLENSNINGSATGETHTLRTSGIDFGAFDSSQTAPSQDVADDTFGEYTIEVDVTAIGDDDLFIPVSDAYFDEAGSTTAGIIYRIIDGDNNSLTSSTSDADALSATLSYKSGNGEEENGFIRVDNGGTVTLELVVTFNPADTATDQYRVIIDAVRFDDNEDATPDEIQEAEPEEDYRTTALTIVS